MTEPRCAMSTKDVVDLLCDIADQVAAVIGNKGSISVFRYAGKKLGERIGYAHRGSPEEARNLVATFFKEKGFMDDIELHEGEARLCGCKIGLVLKNRGSDAGKHALCHFGFGLIDGVMEGVTGHKTVTLHVESTYHEDGVTCRERW